jgi:hypothetical protein
MDLKNLAVFLQYIEFAEADPEWDSPNLLLEPATMRKQYEECLEAVQDVTVKIAPNKVAINGREIAYKAVFPKKITRSMRLYKGNNPTEQAFADAQTFSRKATGQRKNPKVQDNPDTPADEAAANHSASQQSYEALLGHLRGLLEMFAADAKYVTNEPGFSLAELTADADDLEVKNAAVTTTFFPLSNSRISRDNKMYLNENAMFVVQKAYKDYAAGHYGLQDPRYKRLTRLQIQAPRRLR